MRRMSTPERRARLGVRLHLSSGAGDVESVARSLVGLHSSDPATPYLSCRARIASFTVADLEDALYERRSLVRMLGMRRTVFVVPVELAAVMDAACTKSYAAGERRRTAGMIEEQGFADDGAAWIADVERRTLEALVGRGEATATELTKDVRELGLKIPIGEGKPWMGEIGVSTRVLFLLATEGRIVRGRPLGTWLSSQYRWAPTVSWLDGELPSMDADEARTELVRRWLRTFGPGTRTDLKWWTKWTVKQTKDALVRAGAVEVELEGGTGYVLPDDLELEAQTEPWVALLPGLDSTVMGWKERDWYLGPHASLLFDRNGNAGPTVWCDGRIVGGWAQRPDGEVVVRILEDMGAEGRRRIDDESGRLSEWLDDVRVNTRFRSPLEKELAGS